MPWPQLLSTLDVPLGTQVAKGTELFAPPTDCALIDIDDLGDVAICELGRLQEMHQDILF